MTSLTIKSLHNCENKTIGGKRDEIFNIININLVYTKFRLTVVCKAMLLWTQCYYEDHSCLSDLQSYVYDF